ncbi:uncharacterized protein B0H64DRAFT_242893 [Chaetomium fimeti]|uniref:SET domain-containing protein n=1 Tax=Chaetomium fimeti TaxID=1854472 RepID=A0AAE0H8S3_9PEZI|nr:hypothetical protein B0H64DRAFT_242893 [Chaetomium fimeti]
MVWVKSLRVQSPFRTPSRLVHNAVQQIGNRPPSVFEIRSSPNKGLGVFATKEIPRDGLIMRDPLVFRIEHGEDPVQRYLRFTMLPGTTQRAILGLAARQNAKESLAVAKKVRVALGENDWDLVTKIRHFLFEDKKLADDIAKVVHLEDVITTNAHGIYPDNNSVGGLFLNAARINHSCIPNAEPKLSTDDEDKVLRANRDIEAGEEITASYIVHIQPRKARQKLLSLDGWDFTCKCPACDTSHPFSHSHEQRLQAFDRLCLDSDMDGKNVDLKHGGAWSYAALEQAADKTQGRIELLDGHHSLRNFSRQLYLRAFGIAIAKYRMRRLRSDLEDTIKCLEVVIESDKDWYGENHIITRHHKEHYDRLQRGEMSGV